MNAPSTPSIPRLSNAEFIALIAMLFATIAFSIDAMLPALPQIAAELSPDAPNRAQLILTAFVFGMGLGTLVMGPLSDSFGRKPVILWGSALYCAAALVAWAAPSLETVLAARVIQGLGAAAPRVVSQALIRDLYEGRQMARVMSFAMMIFTLVPAVAPLLGTGIIALAGWRGIFLAFLMFALVSSLWLGLRQAETLPRDRRRPLALAPLRAAFAEVLSHRVILLSIAVQTFCFAALFATISSIQPLFDETFGRADSFPFWFAMIALISGSASLLNASLVVRLGMRRMVTAALSVQMVLSGLAAMAFATDALPVALAFPAYLAWNISLFFMVGLTLGNLNALALEPVGHIAGMAASVIGAIATVASVALAAPIGLAFDGTPVPLMASVTALSAMGWALMKVMPKRA